MLARILSVDATQSPIREMVLTTSMVGFPISINNQDDPYRHMPFLGHSPKKLDSPLLNSLLDGVELRVQAK